MQVAPPELVVEPAAAIPEPPVVSPATENSVTVPIVLETPEKVSPKPPVIVKASLAELEDDVVAAKTRIVDFQDAKDSDTEIATTEIEPSPEETPKKKKYARGRRGGKKKNKNKNLATETEPVAVDIDPVPAAEEEDADVVDIKPSVESSAETQVILHDVTKKLGEIGSNKVDMDRHQNYVQNRLEVFEGELIGEASPVFHLVPG